MTDERTRVGGSRLAISAGIIGLVVDAAYVAIIFAQGEQRLGRVAAFAGFILATSGLALAASLFALSPRIRLTMLGAATGGFLTAGVIGIFSIGLPLLIAGVLSGAASVRFARSVRSVPAGAPLLSTVAAIATGTILIPGIVAS